MSKKVLTEKQKLGRFWLWIGICSCVFLSAVAAGLCWFWDFIAAYEASRPQNAIAAYMQDVTAEYLAAKDEAILASVDGHVQSADEAKKVIADSIGNISYAKNTKLSTDTELVYMVLSSGKSLGRVTMTVVSTDEYGFEYWQVTGESFDFSDRMGTSESITVPTGFRVYANGALLDDSYLTETGIHYAQVEEYYANYDLPTRCTYTTKPILGQPELTVTDAAGAPVTIDETTDLERFLQNCTEAQLDMVAEFAEDYVTAYMNFTSVADGQGYMQRNLNALKAYMVPGSKLATRMDEAVVGLIWVTDRRAELNSIDIHRTLRLEEGRYLCDLTYVVDTRDYSGKVQTSANIKLILVETENGLKAESMTTY